jgi:hypothetical protein
MRLGVTFAFGLSYFGNAEYFPPIFLSTVFGICNIFARMSTIFSPMVAEVVPEPILIITILAITASIIASFLRTPHKEGSFASSSQKGKIAFVQDSAVDGKDFNLELDHKPADGLEEVKKELFLLEEEDDEDINQNVNGVISDKQIPSVSDE